MPKGSKGERRPADVIGAAVKVMRIATEKNGRALVCLTALMDRVNPSEGRNNDGDY